MGTYFIKNNEEVWREIGELLKRSKGKRRIAISYCHDVALLPLKAGEVLVCDASDHAVKMGATSAETIKALVDDEVRVFSVEGLHAKVVIAGRHAVVGSMNASERSKTRLLEGALVTDDAFAVEKVDEWVTWLVETKAKPVGKRRIKELLKIEVVHGSYVPPDNRVKAKKRKAGAGNAGWFYLYSESRAWRPTVEKAARRKLPKLKRLWDSANWTIDAIDCGSGIQAGLGRGAKFFLGHFEHYAREPVVYRDCEVLEVGEEERAIYFRYPNDEKLARWDGFKAIMNRHGHRLAYGDRDRAISLAAAADARRNWGSMVDANED